MNFFKYLKKLINILDKLEAVSSILEDISKTASKSVREHSETLPISEKVLKKMDETASKISSFDKTLEDLQKKIK
tara:strand:+ start:396 stop:620 length:225 start_codon:yes stop_codon:yes gene_type:complete